MRAHTEELRAAGTELLFVGTGNAAQGAAFAREHAGGRPVLCDPGRLTFAALGLRRSWLAALRPRLLADALRALRAGHRQGRVQGDAWQLGGLALLDAGGRVCHLQRDGAPGQLLDLAALLTAVAAR